MTRHFILLIILLTGTAHCLYSQSAFLLRGQSGWEGGGGVAVNREAQGMNAYLGYSFRGYLDANLRYETFHGGEVQEGVVTPSVTFYLSKQEDKESIPTFSVTLGFSRYVSKKTETVIVPDTMIVTWRSYERTTESTVNAVKLGVSAQKRIGTWKVFFFQPCLGAGLSLTNAGWDFAMRAGISIGSRIIHGPLLIVTPSIERQSDVSTLIITLGAVF
jgi:hypothetical protein